MQCESLSLSGVYPGSEVFVFLRVWSVESGALLTAADPLPAVSVARPDGATDAVPASSVGYGSWDRKGKAVAPAAAYYNLRVRYTPPLAGDYTGVAAWSGGFNHVAKFAFSVLPL